MLVRAESMQQSLQRPSLASSTKHTRGNKTITLNNYNFSNNNNGTMDQENHNNEAIDNYQHNGNFTIDNNHIINNELSPNSQSKTDIIHNQNVNKDIITICFLTKL